MPNKSFAGLWPVLPVAGLLLLLPFGHAAAQVTTAPGIAPPSGSVASADAKQPSGHLAVLEAAVAAHPESESSWITLAAFLAARRGTPGAMAAIETIERGLKVLPNSAELLIVHARLVLVTGRVDDAVTDYTRAIAANPKLVTAHVELADIYRSRLRNPERALQGYDAALAITPGHLGAVSGRAETLIMLGKVDDAVAVLEKARNLEPQRAPLRLMLADAYVRQRQRAKALQEVEAALKLQPNYSDAHIARGSLLREAGRFADAHQDFDLALAANLESVGALVGRGLTYQAEGKNAPAETYFTEALRLDPDNVIALNGLAWNFAERKTQLDVALRYAAHAAELAPNQPDILDTLGWVLRQRGEAAKAVPILVLAATLRPSAEILTHLGIAQTEIGATTEASKAFLGALRLIPDYGPAKEGLKKLK